MNSTSVSLLHRLQQSEDSKNWNRLVELYAPLIRGWLRSYGVSGADADDLVQAWRRFRRFFFFDRHVDRFPFARFEHHFATQIRTLTAKAAKVHDAPSNDRINGNAIL